jgi:hypothetical protein
MRGRECDRPPYGPLGLWGFGGGGVVAMQTFPALHMTRPGREDS